jgi:hypothetical protein
MAFLHWTAIEKAVRQHPGHGREAALRFLLLLSLRYILRETVKD